MSSYRHPWRMRLGCRRCQTTPTIAAPTWDGISGRDGRAFEVGDVEIAELSPADGCFAEGSRRPRDRSVRMAVVIDEKRRARRAGLGASMMPAISSPIEAVMTFGFGKASLRQRPLVLSARKENEVFRRAGRRPSGDFDSMVRQGLVGVLATRREKNAGRRLMGKRRVEVR